MVFDPDYLPLFARVILWWAETCANILSALSRRAIRSGRDFRVLGPLQVIKVKPIYGFAQKFCVTTFLSFFCKKVFDSFGSGAYNPPPPTGCGANETATRTWRFGASVLEFFDIVDQKEGMRGQRYGATVCASWRRRIDLNLFRLICGNHQNVQTLILKSLSMRQAWIEHESLILAQNERWRQA